MDENTGTHAESEEAFLKGKALLRNEQLLEDKIMALTDYLFDSNQLGIYTPQIYEQLGNSLSLLAQIVAPCLIFAGVLVEASQENMQMLIETSRSLLNVKRSIDLTNYESLLS